MLVPGEAFEKQLFQNIQAADVFVAFVSRNSIDGTQQPQEVLLAQRVGKAILTVRLGEVDADRLPFRLSGPWISVRTSEDPEVIADNIVAALGAIGAVQRGELVDIALPTGIADEIRAEVSGPAQAPTKARAVFIVHGHDDHMMSDVADFVRTEGVEPIILKKLKGGQNTLFEKFRTVGSEAEFAIVLISGDDFGASLDEYNEDGAGERALMYRARQNVVLEMGFFFGKLGWDNVFVLVKAPPRKVPRFERPSDLEGVIFEPYDAAGDWKDFLRTQLKARKLLQ